MDKDQAYLNYYKNFNHLKNSLASNQNPQDSVAQFIESGISLAHCYYRESNILLQEFFLRRVFFEVLNHFCDSLQPESIRKQCLDQIYKPLLALKRFYKTHDKTQQKYYLIEHELRVLSYEFNPY